MIERTILKEKCPLQRLKDVLGKHRGEWEYIVSELPFAWHIKIDRGGETFDDELLEHETYPDLRASYLVEISGLDAKSMDVKVKRGKHELTVHDQLNVAATKKIGDKAVLTFLEGDRSKPFIVA